MGVVTGQELQYVPAGQELTFPHCGFGAVRE